MLLQYLELLSKKRIVLASGSPRRRAILEGIGLAPEVVVSSFAEDLDKAAFSSGGDYALATARGKAADVLRALKDAGGRLPDLVVAADTVVALCDDGCALRVMEKAATAAEAREMLRELSGRRHDVCTGVVVLYRRAGGEYGTRELQAATAVHMAPLSDALLDAYVSVPARYEGKAGAYGIQDAAGCLIERIDGDYYNVMGLPLQRLCATIAELIETGALASD